MQLPMGYQNEHLCYAEIKMLIPATREKFHFNTMYSRAYNHIMSSTLGKHRRQAQPWKEVSNEVIEAGLVKPTCRPSE
jgi:hypothetical protein